MRWTVLILLGLSAACTRLPDRVVRLHRPPMLSPAAPALIASSAKLRPAWVRGSEDGLIFVGQSSAATKETAEQQALSDLRESVARFLSVEVETDQESHSKSDAERDETEVRIDHRAYASTRAEGIEPDAHYWEQLSDGTFRVFLRAELSEADLSRTRLLTHAARARARGREVIVFLVRGKDELSIKLSEELAARLEAEARFAVADRVMVAALVSNASDSFREALLVADQVVEVGATPDGDRCAVAFRLLRRDAAEPRRLEKIVTPRDPLDLEDLAAELLFSALREAR